MGETRGTRLKADWTASPELCAFALELGLNAANITPQFIDHWIAQPGQRGLKLDWDATYRNWCRREAQIRGVRKPNAPNLFTPPRKPSGSNVSDPEDIDRDFAKRWKWVKDDQGRHRKVPVR